MYLVSDGTPVIPKSNALPLQTAVFCGEETVGRGLIVTTTLKGVPGQDVGEGPAGVTT